MNQIQLASALGSNMEMVNVFFFFKRLVACCF